MADDDLTPEEEEQLTDELLRDRAGIDPGKVGPLVDLASIGLVNGAWRNTCVENWHAEGRLHDGDMLRVNSHTTWRVRQLLRRWMRETGLNAETPSPELDAITAEDVWRLTGRLYQWLTNPARKLPTGITLAQLAGDGLAEYEDCADLRLGAFGAQAEDRGTRFGFARAASHGGLACQHWWGHHPRWPAQVQRFTEALDDPADKHWTLGGKHRPSAEPAEIADRPRLRRLLLARPWELSTDSAEWIIDAGIKYIKAAR